MKQPQHIHLALRHDNVLGRDGSEIHASVTQFDLHDFSRLARTYGLGGFHCITELEAQHRISAEILDFWQAGYGRDYNPDRLAALNKLSLHHHFDTLLAQLTGLGQGEPLIFGTSARITDKTLDFVEASSIIERSGRPSLIQFGTSWGLSTEQLNRCDWVLPPIDGYDGYNHLSVRCAAAIVLDRLIYPRHIQHPGDSQNGRNSST